MAMYIRLDEEAAKYYGTGRIIVRGVPNEKHVAAFLSRFISRLINDLESLNQMQMEAIQSLFDTYRLKSGKKFYWMTTRHRNGPCPICNELGIKYGTMGADYETLAAIQNSPEHLELHSASAERPCYCRILDWENANMYKMFSTTPLRDRPEELNALGEPTDEEINQVVLEATQAWRMKNKLLAEQDCAGMEV